MDLRARRELNNGFGNAMARAFELVVTPMVFVAIGYGIGTLVGARPVLTFAFGAFAVFGTIVRLFYRYDLDMRRHEQEGPWAKRA